MSSCIEAGPCHADNGGCCDARATTRHQPCVFSGERLDFIRYILSKRHQGPTTTVSVKSDLNFSSEAEDIILNALGGIALVKDELRVQVQCTASEVRSFKGIRFRDAAGSALHRIEAVAKITMASVHGCH